MKRLNKVGWKRGDAGEFLAVRVAGGAGERFRRLRVVADARFVPLQRHQLERLRRSPRSSASKISRRIVTDRLFCKPLINTAIWIAAALAAPDNRRSRSRVVVGFRVAGPRIFKAYSICRFASPR